GSRARPSAPSLLGVLAVAVKEFEASCDVTSLDVLHLLAQLLDRDLHVDRDRRHLDRRRLRTERVGLAQQLLDEELEALADLAALGEQPRDLVEVRAQPRELLG